MSETTTSGTTSRTTAHHPPPAAPGVGENPTAGLLEILDDLSALVENARTSPLSTNVKIDRDQALVLVEELRAALPTQVARADEVLAEAHESLESAHRRSEEIVASARARAIELVQTEQVVVQAESRAAEIVAEAEQRAASLRNDADEYCDRRLADFAQDLESLGAQVQAGRDKLAERLEKATPRVRWDAVQDPGWPQS